MGVGSNRYMRNHTVNHTEMEAHRPTAQVSPALSPVDGEGVLESRLLPDAEFTALAGSTFVDDELKVRLLSRTC